MAYLLDTHGGKCSLADDETGIVIEWERGNFNETQNPHCEGVVLPEKDPALYIAGNLRRMADYIAENYPELI